jgi:outer membrane protein, multidrug efflux system
MIYLASAADLRLPPLLPVMTARLPVLFCAFLLLGVSSCTVGPKFIKPETAVEGTFTEGKRSGYSPESASPQWWRRLNDSKLNTLVDRALADNKDLRIAASRVDEARALSRAARFDFFPTVTSDASYTNQRASIAQSFPGQDRNTELYDAGFQASWELDLWGRVRKSNWAAWADYESAESLRQDAMVAVAAEVARNYLQLRGLQNELAVAQRNSQNQRDTLKLTESLLQGGRGTELDTSRARSQLNSTLSAIPLIESAILQNIHRLSVLVGTQPSTLKAELNKAKPMPALPSLVRIGDPAELLRRRRDIRSAEKDLEAATHRVGVVTADLFPRVTFNGRASLQATTFSGFGDTGSGATTFGPAISWAAFDMGRVLTQIQASNARVKGQVANYEKTVLNALEETENALVEFGQQRARRNFLRIAAESSEKAATLARERYQNGIDDFLLVLDAERVLLDAQRQLAASETTTATSLVAIYKALGGGWEGDGKAK